MERQHIARVLATKGGNLSNVARILRINRSTLYAENQEIRLGVLNNIDSCILQ